MYCSGNGGQVRNQSSFISSIIKGIQNRILVFTKSDKIYSHMSFLSVIFILKFQLQHKTGELINKQERNVLAADLRNTS